MPVHILGQLWENGISSVPYGWTLLKILPVAALICLLKFYFNGATNTSERNMHSKVVMMTVSLPHHPEPHTTENVNREACQASEQK